MEYYATNISSAHQKATQHSWCLETPQCSCSQCKMEADYGCFTITDGPLQLCNAKSGLSERLDQSPKIAYFPDGHRCKRFPCPICNPGRSQREGMPGTPPSQMLEHPQAVPVIFFGDGGHKCRKFPCPICHTRRASLQADEF